MDNKEAKALLDKYFAGNCSPGEKRWVERAYQLQDDAYPKEITPERFEEMKAQVWSRLDLSKAEEATPVVRLWPKPAPNWIRGIAMVAAVAAIVFGVWFYSSKYQDASIKTARTAGTKISDIAPGRNGATITLANGKVIPLSDKKNGVIVGNGKLTYDDGSALSASVGEMSMMLTASTSRGQTYQFTLPDGTHVWLNADSKISFPRQFNGIARKVLLDGEGYFEVAKLVRGNGAEHVPFIVETSRQKIEVLGTHFNVNAYKDEVAMRTTLLEGRVKVEDGGVSHILAPGNQAYSGLDGLRILDVDVAEAVDWKNGDFIFNEETLDQIMKRVARWYDVSVDYEPGIDKQQTFGGKVSRSKNISAVLNSMQSTGKVSFKIAGKQITVTK